MRSERVMSLPSPDRQTYLVKKAEESMFIFLRELGELDVPCSVTRWESVSSRWVGRRWMIRAVFILHSWW